MDNSQVQQLKRGTMEMILLSLIGNHNCSYGYAILNVLDQTGEDLFRNSKPGTIYPILYRLEAEKLIRAVDDNEKGSQRKKYKITPQGKKALEDMIDVWNRYISVVNKFI